MVTGYVSRGIASGAIARHIPDADDAKKQEILALNAAGIFGREIARRVNVKVETVSYVIYRAGVEPAFTAYRRELNPKILALWEAGWKSDAIAAACGVTVDQVRSVAKHAAVRNPTFRRQAPRLSVAEMDRIASLRREGCYSSAEIAELMDVDYAAVKRAIRKLAQSESGLLPDRTLLPKNRIPEALLLMAQGLPPKLIAEHFGVDGSSMTAWLREMRRRAKRRIGLVRRGVALQLPVGSDPLMTVPPVSNPDRVPVGKAARRRNGSTNPSS